MTSSTPHAPTPLVYELDQVADMLGCAATTVEERARSGELPGLKYGDGGWRFPAAALAHRLNELAIERSLELRTAKHPRKAGGVLKSVPTSGKAKRVLPVLPPLDAS